MTRFRLFCLKNAMVAANLAATAIGSILLYVIYEFVLRDYRTDQYVEFHIRTSNYLGAIFTLFFALIIVLSTDGVWEAHSSDGEIFGKERLNEIIRQHAAKKAEELIEAVITAVNQFQSDSGAEDDITLIVIKKEAE